MSFLVHPCYLPILDSFRHIHALPHNLRVALFGAGERGRIFKNVLTRHRPDITIVNFIDSYANGVVGGISIVSPTIFSSSRPEVDLIIITSNKWEDIEATTSLWDVPCVRADIEHFRYIGMKGSSINPYVEQQFTENELQALRQRVTYIKERFSDDESRAVYAYLCAKRGLGEVSESLALFRNPEDQYMDHIKKEKIGTVIEGGVYDGRATNMFVQLMPNLAALYGFEPCIHAFEQGIYYDALSKHPNLHISCAGLWSSPGTVSFNEDEYCSCVTADATAKNIEVISIDNFVREKGLDVDFIKLDIEGAEMHALKGACSVMERNRPQLAISIYHSKEDMVNIPHFLMTTLNKYNFYIGHYSPHLIETILYAVPREICI